MTITMQVKRISYLLLMTMFAACSTIDDDLSDCPTTTQEATLDYELRLVTNMTTEVQTQLTAQTDVALAASLTSYLSNIFTDYAKDVNLSFYDTQGDSTRLHHDQHIMNASEHSYTLYISRQKYMHLAVANIEGDPVVHLEEDNSCHDAVLRQVEGDTIDSHSTGIFTARQLMEMIEGIDQTFNVKLYMANCSAMLVVDPNGHDTSKMNVFTTGFATAFHIADSVYEYKTPSPMIRTRRERMHRFLLCQLPLARGVGHSTSSCHADTYRHRDHRALHRPAWRRGPVGVPCLRATARWQYYKDCAWHQGTPACRTAENREV